MLFEFFRKALIQLLLHFKKIRPYERIIPGNVASSYYSF